MTNGSILHKRLGDLYNVGDYELFYTNPTPDKTTKPQNPKTPEVKILIS